MEVEVKIFMTLFMLWLSLVAWVWLQYMLKIYKRLIANALSTCLLYNRYANRCLCQ